MLYLQQCNTVSLFFGVWGASGYWVSAIYTYIYTYITERENFCVLTRVAQKVGNRDIKLGTITSSRAHKAFYD